MFTTGFNLSGLLRSTFSPTYIGFLVISLTILLILFLSPLFIKKTFEFRDEEEFNAIRSTVNIFKVIILVLIIVTFGVRISSIMISSRVPRCDVQKSEVYNMMK